MTTLNETSLSRLKGVHPALVVRVHRLSDRLPIMVIEGLRTLERQKALYAQGRTKPGKKVTWTMASKHLAQADGLGHAVDLGPSPLDWNDSKKFDAIAAEMLKVDAEMDDGFSVRWGGNWDGDDRPHEKGETDGPHFELVIAKAAPRADPVRPPMRLGDSGEDVARIQRALKAAGWDSVKADGSFGPKTEAAVKAFQTQRGLVADGIVGPMTLTALALA